MNDLQFQRQLQVDPSQLDEAMLSYLEKNPEMKKMLKKARTFDQQIEQALDIDVPEGLEARILLKQSYMQDSAAKISQKDNQAGETQSADLLTLPRSEAKVISLDQPSLPWWGLGGIAASLLVVSFTMTLWFGPVGVEKIAANDVVAHIVDHVEEDPQLMTAFKVPENQQDLQKLFLAVGASLNEPIDQMSYAGECVIKGQKGLHVVMQGDQGPVTVIVLPGQQLESMVAFEASGYQGELLPVKGGVVAIVGNSMEQLSQAHMRFFKAVKFA